MTNREYLKQRTDLSFALWLGHHIDCEKCPIKERCQSEEGKRTTCTKLLLTWLKENKKPTKEELRITKAGVLEELGETKRIISQGVGKCFLNVSGMTCIQVNKILERAINYIEQIGDCYDCSGSSENL